MQQRKTFRIATLGCRTNQYESQAYQDQLLAMGYVPAEEGEEATICVVNTCTVTESADSHSRHEIRHLARQNPNSKLVVTGCFADRQPEQVANLPGVTHVIPNKNKEKLLEEILVEENIPEFSIKNFEAHTRAFLKVQDGCNSFCTYCIIPYVRGRSTSRTIPEVVKEAETLIANGYKEIVLTGINVGDFDGNVPGEKPQRLVDLVRAVDKIPGLYRLRVSSIDPDEVDDALADAILNGRTTCNSMHLVLQSGSNVVLKRMNRKYNRQVFLNTVEKLKQIDPDFTVTTDIIVGFPGETDSDFEETLMVMREVKFAKVHMFPYSERPRTRAALMPNKIPQEIIRQRKQMVLQVAEETGFELRQKYVGKEMLVLTEGKDNHLQGCMTGHTTNFLPVIISDSDLRPNTIVNVLMLENTPKGLVGRIVNKP